MKYSLKELISEKISGEWGDEPVNGQGCNILRTANFTNSGRLNFEKVVKRNIPEDKIIKKHLKCGDIIIEKSGGSPNQPVGRVVFFELETSEKYLCNNFTTVLRPDTTKIYPKYFFYRLHQLHTRGRTLKYQNKTTGIINLKLDKYLEEEIDIPELSEQKHISYLLSKAESLIAQRIESIRLLDEFVKSTFLEMFGDNTKFPVVPILSLCKSEDDIKCGPFGSQLKNHEYVREGVPLWSIMHVNRHFNAFPGDYVTKEKANELKQYNLLQNDIVITRKATVGKAAIYPQLKEGIMHSDLLRIRVDNQKANPLMILFQFHYSKYIEEQVKKVSGGAVTSGINVTKLKKLKVLLPPTELQMYFSEIVNKVNNIRIRCNDSLTELENLYSCMSQKAFMGELRKF